VCCGTGDLSLALARGLGKQARVLGADFAFAMLERARAKAATAAWIQGDALRLPFAAESFAAVTSAFGFRNLSDYRAGLAEFRRLLEPGGLLAILEITEPSVPILGSMYRIYFERLLPRLGGWISGQPEAYRYLPDSVSRFPAPDVLAAWMREMGYNDPRCVRFGGGIATLHLARKPPA
ncbi:MAG: ubiquinone/menaquinone biosynthesis methyltransferase, partial [Terriglobales bacterium]